MKMKLDYKKQVEKQMNELVTLIFKRNPDIISVSITAVTKKRKSKYKILDGNFGNKIHGVYFTKKNLLNKSKKNDRTKS